MTKKSPSDSGAVKVNRIVNGIVSMHPLSDPAIYKVIRSNKLIAAQSQLGARHQKVLAACISLVDPHAIYDNGITVELNDAQLEHLTGITKRNIISFIDEAAKSFHEIAYKLHSDVGQIHYINIAEESIYDPKERVFRMKFHKKIEPELLDLALYTSVHLRYLTSLSTKYSMRLFELISMYYNEGRSGTQFWTPTLDELYFPLGLQEADGTPILKSYINNVNNFQTKVLNPSISEINEKTAFHIEHEPQRVGREIGKIIFIIRMNKQTFHSKGGTVPTFKEGSVGMAMLDHGMSPAIAKRLIETKGETCCLNNVAYMDRLVDEAFAINNKGAFLASLIRDDVAGLPWFVNSYSDRFDNLPELYKGFAKYVAKPIWWTLSEGCRSYICSSVTEGAFPFEKSLVTRDDFIIYQQLVAESSIDQTAVLVQHGDMTNNWENLYEELTMNPSLFGAE